MSLTRREQPTVRDPLKCNPLNTYLKLTKKNFHQRFKDTSLIEFYKSFPGKLPAFIETSKQFAFYFHH